MKKSFLAIVMALMLIATIPVYSYAQKIEPPLFNQNYITLNSDPSAMPLSIVSDGGSKVYVTEYWFKGFYEVDLPASPSQSPTVTTHLFVWGGTPWNDVGIEGYGIAYADSKLYISGRRDEIGVYNTVTDATSIIGPPIVKGDVEGLLYYQSYIWAASNFGSTGFLLKIDPATDTIVTSYTIPYYLSFLCGDGTNIYITSVIDNVVIQFNTISGTVTNTYTGFDRPLGIAKDATNVYVAENSETSGITGKIAVINKTTGEITRLDTGLTITNEGPLSVYVDTRGYLWFTDNSKHFGVIDVTSGSVNAYSDTYYCYYMTQVQNSMLFVIKNYDSFGYLGLLSIPPTFVVPEYPLGTIMGVVVPLLVSVVYATGIKRKYTTKIACA